MANWPSTRWECSYLSVSSWVIVTRGISWSSRLEAAGLEIFSDLNSERPQVLKQSAEGEAWQTPCELTAKSEEGLLPVLARLEELKATTVPRRRWR